jgi:hypothetical protein
MANPSQDVLDNEFQPLPKKRRALLPTWIKIFVWIFMVFGLIAPLGLIAGLLGISFELSLYGLETFHPISFLGLGIILLFALKGTVAFGLWLEKTWAVLLAMIDATLGIIICIFSMVILPLIVEDGSKFLTFRFEILLLIPYFVSMNRIRALWENRA